MNPPPARTVHFAIPGALDRQTGGYGYDRALIALLPDHGWDVRHLALPDGFPLPGPAALEIAGAALAALPDGAVLLADGLAFGAMDRAAEAQAHRLRMVALVHHPLADETGLAPQDAARLLASERRAVAAARAVICTSHATARRLEQGFAVPAGRITVAPPGTLPAQRAGGAADGVPMILSVGALSPRKGHDLLIAALAGLADLPWRARIVGPVTDPDLRATLAAQIAAAGLQNRVTLVGPVADVAAEFRGADVFALATWHEGYGMAFAEALAHGLPVVGTRAGPVADEVVPPAAGILVSPGDVAGLRAGLARLLGDAAARQSAAAAAWEAARTLPRWEETAARVAEVLNEVSA